jgi:hypothetical protein
MESTYQNINIIQFIEQKNRLVEARKVKIINGSLLS